ncbi:MAG: hypothetical protein ACXWC6_18610 [Ramlibacter sp.]
MNIHKHMEAIFLAALVIIGGGAFALDDLPAADAAAPVMRGVTTPAATALVMCSPKAPAPRHA